MLTRCPACETHFRVTAEQLKARSGRVRCGECQHVFNALDSLIEVAAVPPPATAPPPQPFGVPGAELEAGNARQPEDATQSEPAATPGTGAEPPLPSPALQPATQQLPVQPAREEEVAQAPEPVIAAKPDATEAFSAPPPPPPRRWPWAVGAAFALAALVLQAVLAFRVELAVLWPEARPALVALCELAECEVGLPAKVALVGIEASDLYPDSTNPGRLTLTATLKNRAPFAQQFPHLELTLTDTDDKAIARRVLTPADYLPATNGAAAGMPANADIVVAVGVDPGATAANGYRLYLFYP